MVRQALLLVLALALLPACGGRRMRAWHRSDWAEIQSKRNEEIEAAQKAEAAEQAKRDAEDQKLEKSCERGNGRACFEFGRRANDSGDYPGSLFYAKRACKLGHMKGCVVIERAKYIEQQRQVAAQRSERASQDLLTFWKLQQQGNHGFLDAARHLGDQLRRGHRKPKTECSIQPGRNYGEAAYVECQ